MYMMGGADTDKTRDVFDRAVEVAGLHVGSGALLWQAYREYEQAILDTIKVSVVIFRLEKRVGGFRSSHLP